MIATTPLTKNPRTAAQLATETPPSTKLAPLNAPTSHKGPLMPDLPPGRPIPPEVDFDEVPSRKHPSLRFRPQGASVSLVTTTYRIDPDGHISLSHLCMHAYFLAQAPLQYILKY